MKNAGIVFFLVVTWFPLVGMLRANDAAIAVAWNDFDAGTGLVGAISADAPWNFRREPIAVGLDSVLHSAFGKLYVLSGGDRTVRVVDPATWTIERSYELAPGDEPVDIHVASPDLAYVTRRNAKQLLELDLATGMTHEGANLDVFADADGIPDLGTMAAHDGRLFIQIQRVNFDEPAPQAQPFVAVVDLDSGQLIDVDPGRDGLQAIELDGTFPKTKMQVIAETGELFVSATGGFFDEGGIEVIDLQSLQSKGLAIREADDFTGADLGAFVMVGPDQGFLVYSTDLLLSSHLHQFSRTGGVDPDELAVALDYFSPAIAFDPDANSIFLPIGGSLENGLLAFDAVTGARLTDRLIPTSGPPTDLIRLTSIPEPATLIIGLVACSLLVQAAIVRRFTRPH